LNEICEVELCTKEATFSGLCMLHRKKAVSGELEFDDDGTIWDTCSKGHRWTEANTHWESNSKGGKRRRCRICLAVKAQRKRDEEPVVMAPNPVRPKNKAMTEAMASFDAAQANTKTKCAGKYEQWTDYTAENAPTDSQARAMCDGCPFLMACANNAAAIEPYWGVWGGAVWYAGSKLYNREEMINAETEE
jgi:hypothetical protein